MLVECDDLAVKDCRLSLYRLTNDLRLRKIASLLVLIARNQTDASISLFIHKCDGPIAVPLDLKEPFIIVKRFVNQCRQHGMDRPRHRSLYRAPYPCKLIV